MLSERSRPLRESDVRLAVMEAGEIIKDARVAALSAMHEAGEIIKDARVIPFSLDKTAFESLRGSLAPSFEIARQNSDRFSITHTGKAAHALENSTLDKKSNMYNLTMSRAQITALTSYCRLQRVNVHDVIGMNEAFIAAGGRTPDSYKNLLDSMKRVR